MNNRLLKGLGLGVCCVALGALGVGAQQPPSQQVDGPIVIEGKVWPSRAALVAAGRRCATPMPDLNARFVIERALSQFKAARGGAQRHGPATVPVWVHVIRN